MCVAGVATFISNCPGGPQVLAIFRRAGWSIGDVIERYIEWMDGQDQFVGRCAAGVSVLDNNFDQLPPHYHGAILTDADWCTILPTYESLPHSFKPVLPFLLASLVKHHEFLLSKLHANHTLFISPLFTSGIMARLLDAPGRVLGGHAFNPQSGMRASGVPPLTSIARKIDDVDKKIDVWGSS